MDLFSHKPSKKTLPLRQRAEDESAHLSFLMAQADKAVASILHGEHRQRRPGSGERFWQFREYHPGDRPQDIDWRQSGKTDRVYIRQKEWQTNQSAWFWCNQTQGMDFKSNDNLPTKSEAAKIITLALALLLTHSGEEAGLLGSMRKGRSEAALQNIMEGLQHSNDFPQPLPTGDAPRNSSLFFTGDFLEPISEIESCFRSFAAQSDTGFVIQILDPAEIELPYEGRVLFKKTGEEKNGGQREIINNVSSIRAEYNRRIMVHIQAVKDICGSCGWPYVLHVTNREIKDTLLEIWTILTPHIGVAQR